MVLGDGRPAAPERGRRPGASPSGGARQAACALATALGRRCLGAAPGRARRQEAVSRLSLPDHRRCRQRPPHSDQRQAFLRSRRQLLRLSRHRHGHHRGRHRRSRQRAPRPFRPADRPSQPHAALRRGRSRRCAGPRPRPAGGAAAHRPRPLSRDQRHAWALDRRSPAQGLRAAPRGVHRCWRPPGAHQRRRVRDRAARPGAAGRCNAAVSPCAGELHRAVRSRRPGGDRWRQRRRRPDRRRRGERRGDQERRHRAVSRQARGARHLLRVRAGHGGAAAPAPRARVGPQARPGGGRVSAGLPAADRRRDADGRGDRGAGPLAAPRARPARCQGLHRRGRRDRPDPAARPMGPAHGLRAGREVAGAAGRGQPVAAAVPPSRPSRPGRRGAAGERPRGRPPRARGSRGRAAARSARPPPPFSSDCATRACAWR